MLCEECHVNEANFTVSVVAGEETTVRHLCADCMSRMNADLMKGNVRNLLSTVLNAIRATEDDNRKEFSMPIFGRFTQRAQQTLMLAQRIAAELQQPYVGTEHFLLALLKTGASVPEAVSARMSYESVVGELREHLKEVGDPEEARGTRIELSPRAKKTLEKWLRKKHFGTGKMKKNLLKGEIPGVYWPLWAFSDDVSSEYYGDAGYRVPASEKDDPAKARKIRWEPVTGTVESAYNDIMTPASERMETEDFCDPSSYRMGGLKPYTPEYLAGFCCEKPTLDVRESWRQAQQQVDRRMAAAAQEKVLAEADETAVRRLISTHDNVRFRMVLLPVYMRVYPHGKKRYRVMINGQTGEFSGEAPRSPWRILAVVGIVLLLLMILFYLFVLHGDGKYLLYSA